ncbi:1-phosphofructokinase family hexose kinase [Spirochaeta thermophila]|uniref:Putative sugar kinase n=1 Tax=Winmispira thermophila (strain ATCC 49972 / DSM 6192 / RI 19.B1) TaxID=665571 RepID=E0RP23_WINT6|nr:PfkB family carbohydrate kinase [Spirochaeta thermophila]ADN02685.1 putative sugar kinase [Spirochaeta thermophila DSM 6192]
MPDIPVPPPPLPPYFLVVCPSPTFQRTLRFDAVRRGAVNRARESSLCVAGKGHNVCRTLSQLGQRAVHLTHLGGLQAPLYLHHAHREGIHVHAVSLPVEIRTCTTVIEADGAVTELVEESPRVPEQASSRLTEAFFQLLSGAHTLILTGKPAPGYPADLYARMAQAASRTGVRLIVDIRGPELEAVLPHRPLVVTPNLEEFSSTFLRGAAASRDQAAAEALRLARAYHTAFAITCGPEPLILAGPDGVDHVPVPRVPAVNTIGCGDAFTAGLALALHRGKPLQEAASFAARCASESARTLVPASLPDPRALILELAD